MFITQQPRTFPNTLDVKRPRTKVMVTTIPVPKVPANQIPTYEYAQILTKASIAMTYAMYMKYRLTNETCFSFIFSSVTIFSTIGLDSLVNTGSTNFLKIERKSQR